MYRFIFIALVILLVGCSGNKAYRPADIQKHKGNYLDVFSFDTLPLGVKKEIRAISPERTPKPSEIAYAVKYSSSGVKGWEGTEIWKLSPDTHGLSRIEENVEVNGFLIDTNYKLSYFGVLDLDYQSVRSGYRDFSNNARVAKLDFIESNPKLGIHYKAEHGLRSQLADFWKFEYICTLEGERRDAKFINENLTGDAFDFKCTTYDQNNKAIAISRKTYVEDINLFLTREMRNVNGSYVYTLKSIVLPHANNSFKADGLQPRP